MDKTHVVQAPGRISIRHDLQGGVVAVADAESRGYGARHAGDAEAAGRVLLHGREQDQVEGRAGVGAETEQDLHGGGGVAHFQGDGPAAEGPRGARRGWRVLPAAGEGGDRVFVEGTRGRVDELEVGGGDGEGEEEREEGGHGEMHVVMEGWGR